MSIINTNTNKRFLSELLPGEIIKKSAEEIKKYDQLLQILENAIRALESPDRKQFDEDIEETRVKLRDCKKRDAISTRQEEFKLLLIATENAICALETGDLEKFDAVVGENACQIRTVKIAMIASKCFVAVKDQILTAKQKNRILSENFTEAEKTIQNLSEHLKSLKKEPNEKIKEDLLKYLLKIKKELQPLQSLLKTDEAGLDIVLTSDDLFLIESYLLSEAKEVKSAKPNALLCRNDAIVPKKLEKLGVSATYADDLIKNLRTCLSGASVEFVRELAQNLEDENLQKMCSKEFTINYQDKQCIPMFWTYKTLLLSAQKEKIPLVIYAKFLAPYAFYKEKVISYQTVDEELLFFQPTVDDTENPYQERIPSERDLEKVSIVIQGVVCASKIGWSSKINPWEAILAGAADHRQYPDEKQDARFVDGKKYEEYKWYKSMANEKGFSDKEPTTFFIQHVYPSRVDRFPQLKRKAVTEMLEHLFSKRLSNVTSSTT